MQIICLLLLTVSTEKCILSVLVVIVHYKRYSLEEGAYMIILDYKDARPIYEQVVEKFKLLILKVFCRRIADAFGQKALP